MTSKVVLITGAAMGLGRALTDCYHKKGWSVISTDINEDGLKDRWENPNIRIWKMDVTSDDSVRSVFEALRDEKITLDLIINNAGIDRYFPLSETPAEKFKEVFEVNLFGSYRVNQNFLPLLKRPGGRIIHIGSESLNLTIPFMPYPISKNAVERYAKVLRQELKFLGIDVIVIRPGAIRTELLDQVFSIKSVVKSKQLAVQFAKFASDAPQNIGKVLETSEVAGFIYDVSLRKNPKAVYKINNNLKLRFISLMPFSLIERLIHRKLNS